MKIRKLICCGIPLFFMPMIAWHVLNAENDKMSDPKSSSPLVVASEVEIRDSDRGMRVAKLYKVDAPVESIELVDPRNMTLVYSDDPGFRRYVGYYFDEMANDKEFTGDTWYSSRPVGGFRLRLIEFDANGAITEKVVEVDAASIVIWEKGK